MNGFIEVHSEGTKVILPVALIAATEKDGKGEIRFDGVWYSTDESLTDIIAKIEAAQGETITAELCQAKDVNVYYRTADRLPNTEDADATGFVFVSDELEYWTVAKHPESYVFWSPVPKVEARP